MKSPAPKAVFEGKGTLSTFPNPQKLLFVMENPLGLWVLRFNG